MDWAKTTTRLYEKHLSFGIWWDLYWRFYSSHFYDGQEEYHKYKCTDGIKPLPQIAGLVENYGISNTIVLEIP